MVINIIGGQWTPSLPYYKSNHKNVLKECYKNVYNFKKLLP